MKRFLISRRQILRAIRAACIVLFFVASAQQAAQAQAYNGSDFQVNGSIVTVPSSVNDPSGAYFYDSSTNGYAISVQSGAVIGNSSLGVYNGNLLAFDHGSVTNAGTLTASNYAIDTVNNATVTNSASGSISGAGAGIVIGGTGTITNSGYIGNSSYSGGRPDEAIEIFGVGTVTNKAGGTISGTYGGVYIAGSGSSVTNAKTSSISGSYYGVDLNSDGTVLNRGTITTEGSYAGVGIEVAGTASVTNSGTITVNDHDQATGIAIGNGTVINTGDINVYDAQTVSGIYLQGGGNVINTGSISASTYGDGPSYGVDSNGSGSLTNSGSITAGYTNNYNYAVYFNGDATIANTGSITAFDSNAGNYGVYVAGVAHVTNSGGIEAYDGFGNCGVYIGGSDTVYSTFTNTASGYVTAYYDANGTGLYIGGLAQVTNSGYIGGSTYGINLQGDDSSIVTTGGKIYGGVYSVLLQGDDNLLVVTGRTDMEGLMYGYSTANGNTLILHLVGMTPAQAAAANAQSGDSSGEFSTTGDGGGSTYTYAWSEFSNVDVQAISLEQAVDAGLKPIATRIDNEGLPVAYDSFYAAAFSNPEAALNSLTGRAFLNVVGQVGLSESLAFSELADSRAFGLRLGANGIDFSGLNLQSGSLLASLGGTESILTRISPDSIFGGATMSDSKDAKETVPLEPKNRWGAWISGTLTLGDESGSATTPGFNVKSGSPTIGADYRLFPDLVVGALVNFDASNVNFGDSSRLNVYSEMIGAYVDWVKGPWFIDGLAGGGLSEYEQRRFTLAGPGVDDAKSSPNGYEALGSITGGYDFKFAGWVVSPEVGLLYTHLTRDAYGETEAGAYDLTVGRQDIDSLRTKLGVQATYPFNWDAIKFTPNIHASWYHECLDDTEGVETSLAGAPDFGSFTVQTNPEGRDFAVAGVGLEMTPAELHNDITFFFAYDAQAGQSHYVAHSVDGGLRVGF